MGEIKVCQKNFCAMPRQARAQFLTDAQEIARRERVEGSGVLHGGFGSKNTARLYRALRRRWSSQQNGGQGRAPPCSVGAGGAVGAAGACVKVADAGDVF